MSKIRLAAGQVSLTQQMRTQDRIDGQWTVAGLARHLGVRPEWLRRRIRLGLIPVDRYRGTRYLLIPDDPALVTRLAAEGAPLTATRAAAASVY